MKVNIEKLSLKNGNHSNIELRRVGQYAIDKDKSKQNLQNNNINRPAQAISFGGSTVSAAQTLAEKTGDFIAGRKTLNKLTSFVSDNEVAYNAIYSLIIAGILKPVCVVKQKGTADKKDKQYIATKNFLQAFIGSFLGMTIGGGLIKKGFDTMKNNIALLNVEPDGKTLSLLPYDHRNVKEIAQKLVTKEKTSFASKVSLAKEEFANREGIGKITGFVSTLFKKIKYKPNNDEIIAKSKELVKKAADHKPIFEKAPEFVKALKVDELVAKNRSITGDAFESFWKGSSGWITTLMKAKIASWMLPAVTTFLFVKKGLDKAKDDEIKQINDRIYSPLLVSNSFKQDMGNFKDFSGDKTNTLSFNGSILESGIDNFAKGLEKLAVSGFGQGCTNTMARLCKKPSPRMGDLESWLLTGYWVGSTTMSKKIEPDQKLGMNVHTVSVSAVSSVLALLIDSALDPLINMAKNSYSRQLTSAAQDVLDRIKSGENIDAAETIKQNCSKLYHINGAVKKLFEDGKMFEGPELEQAIKKVTKSYGKDLGKFKSLTIFTLVVRFLVPVLMVEASAKIKQAIKKKRQEKQEASQIKIEIKPEKSEKSEKTENAKVEKDDEDDEDDD